jgi:hypothetical protein
MCLLTSEAMPMYCMRLKKYLDTIWNYVPNLDFFDNFFITTSNIYVSFEEVTNGRNICSKILPHNKSDLCLENIFLTIMYIL